MRVARSTVVALALLVASTGCTAHPEKTVPIASSSPPAAARTPTTPAAEPQESETPPDEFEVLFLESEPLLGALSSVRGTDEIGPYPTRTGRVAVYIRCWGDGKIEVEIENSASFTQQCLRDGDDPGTRNTLDVIGDTVRATGSAENSNLWAIAVTEIPPR